MHVSIKRIYLQSLGYGASDVHLESLSPSCAPLITPDEVIFKIPFSGCGTVREVRKCAFVN